MDVLQRSAFIGKNPQKFIRKKIALFLEFLRYLFIFVKNNIADNFVIYSLKVNAV